MENPATNRHLEPARNASACEVSDLCLAYTHWPFPVAMVEGKSHRIRYANPAFCRMVQQKADALLGTTVESSLPECSGCLSLLTRVIETGAVESYTDQRTPEEQSPNWSFAIWPALSPAGQILGAMIQVTETSDLRHQSKAVSEALMIFSVRQHELAEAADTLTSQLHKEIAERKRSEEALEATQQSLRLALESARASTWEWDVKNDRLHWSDEVRVLCGSEESSREAPYRAWRSLIREEDRILIDSVREQAAESSEEINVEFRVQRVDSRTLWMLARGRLGRIYEGQAISYSGILIDITERKHAEQVLLRSEKLNGVGRLAATLAHEINNPLDAAMNALYIVQSDPSLSESAQQFVGIADDELRRVAHMARQSLGFYREEAAPTTFPLSLVVESALDLLKNRLIARSITVQRRFQQDAGVTAVFGELRQIFVNLIANSVDALDVKGVIALRIASCTSHRNGGRELRVTIADNGRGMDGFHLSRIFEPFFTTKGELGTGLGLWVTKQLVEKHGGTIRVRSRTGLSGSGTTFSITFPG